MVLKNRVLKPTNHGTLRGALHAISLPPLRGEDNHELTPSITAYHATRYDAEEEGHAAKCWAGPSGPHGNLPCGRPQLLVASLLRKEPSAMCIVEKGWPAASGGGGGRQP